MTTPKRAEPANEHAYAEALKKVAEGLKEYGYLHKEVDICLGAASAMNRMAAEIERLAARVRELERERAEVMDVPPLPSG